RRGYGCFFLALNLDAHGTAKRIEQLGRANRLINENGNAGVQRAGVVAAQPNGGEQQHWQMLAISMASDLFREFQSVQVWQLQVKDGDVKGSLLGQGAQSFAIGRDANGTHSPLLGALGDNALIGEIVFDNQQSFAGQLRLRYLPGRRAVGGGGTG